MTKFLLFLRHVPLCVLTVTFASSAFAADPSPSPAGDIPVTSISGTIGLIYNKANFPPAYPIPYLPATEAQIKTVMDRALGFLITDTPVYLFDRDTHQHLTDLTSLPKNPGINPTDYPLMSYEWGVTYSGMLLAADVTKDARYRDYVTDHFAALAAVAARQRDRVADTSSGIRVYLDRSALRGMVAPRNMDDCGALCNAMLEATHQGLLKEQLQPCIDTAIQLISQKQMRLDDQTLARRNPLPHTLWLDDLYMSVPALAQMGVATGDRKYFDDACRQVKQFSARMFVPETGLFMHGWAQEMDPHPAFHWARANGWAIAAMADLLSVLPEDHPDREAVLKIFRAHAAGIAAHQDTGGLWHQLLDRQNTYLETSASALYVYAIARGVNRGWLNQYTYGGMLSLGWNAIAQQVDKNGQIDNVCIGTGMAFDPAFYANRPTSVWAAHGPGPVLLAGAEMIAFRRGKGAIVNRGGVMQMYQQR